LRCLAIEGVDQKREEEERTGTVRGLMVVHPEHVSK
jgi:hypothetical protein